MARSLLGLRVAEEEDERQADHAEDSEQPEIVNIGTQRSLLQQVAVKHSHGQISTRSVADLRGERMREPLERVPVNRIAAVEAGDEDVLMRLLAAHQQRGDHGDAQAGAQVAQHVVKPGSRSHQFPGQRLHGQGGEGNEQEAVGESVHDVGPDHAAHAHGEIEISQHEER